MPQLGESIVEATLLKWRVSLGTAVIRGEVLAEVETDKATSEIYAPVSGRLREIIVQEGSTVEVGTQLATLDASSEVLSPQNASSGPKPHSPHTATGVSLKRLPSKRLSERPRDPTGSVQRSSPAVRRLLREHQLDISTLRGTGARGRVTKHDVLTHLSSFTLETPEVDLPPPTYNTTASDYRIPRYTPQPLDTIEPFSRRRSQIADHMITSLRVAAHVATVAEIDMQSTLRAKAIDTSHISSEQTKLSLTTYIVWAIARTLGKYPRLNATVRDQELVLRAERNIGVAVDTNIGIVVPVLHRTDELSLLGIAHELTEKAERARSNKLKPADVVGGSFTLSNPGSTGNLFGISIIRQPEVAILRTGSIVKRAIVRSIEGEDMIVIRPMMYACLSYDHRVIDGREANAFLSTLTSTLETMRPQLAG